MQIETGEILFSEEFRKRKEQLKDQPEELEKYLTIEESDMTEKEKRLKQGKRMSK